MLHSLREKRLRRSPIHFESYSTRETIRSMSDSEDSVKTRETNNGGSSSKNAETDDTVYGPTLPGNLTRSQEICGPALPPHLLNRSQQNTFGPTLPLNYGRQEVTITNDSDQSDDESDIIVGPLPKDVELTPAQLALEERALEIKLGKLDNGKNKKADKREEWMLQLPAIKAIGSGGVTNRQFQTKDRPDFSDRSSWTDTPESKLEKAKNPNFVENQKTIQDQARLIHIKQRDMEQEKLAAKHKKKHKRDKSLIEIHKKKLNKEKNNKPEIQERRPFSREVDLQPNRFDQAKTDSVIKKARLLDSRFSSGSSKFL